MATVRLPPFVVARILSYNVETTEDVAKMRLLSREAVTMLPSLARKHHFIKCPNRSSEFEDEITDAKGDDFETSSVTVGEEWLFDDEDRAKNWICPFEGAFVSSMRFIGKPINLKEYGKVLKQKRDKTKPRKGEEKDNMEAVEEEKEDETMKEEGDGVAGDDDEGMDDGNADKDEEIDKDDEDEEEGMIGSRGTSGYGPTEKMAPMIEIESSEEEKYKTLKRVCQGFDNLANVDESFKNFKEVLQSGLLSFIGVDYSAGDVQVKEEEEDNLSWIYRYPLKLSFVLPKDSPSIDEKFEVDGQTYLKIKATKPGKGKPPILHPHPNDENQLFRALVVSETRKNFAVDAILAMTAKYDDMIEVYDEREIIRNAPAFTGIWEKCQRKTSLEGVAIVDGVISTDFADRLRSHMNDLRALQEKENRVDYHPHSNDTVRDLVHPALYAYVEGVSSLRAQVEDVEPCIFPHLDEVMSPLDEENDITVEGKDFWGRTYETSAYQWLPTYFSIAADGRVTIEDYINNLVPREDHTELYNSLAKLFELAFPYIESVYSYVRSIRPYLRNHGEEMDYNTELKSNIDMYYASLRRQKVQVIPKIVDYELKPGQTYDGVWHVEGMSHEEIVCTCLYILDRDEEIQGGQLEFKRAFFSDEAECLFSRIAQERHPQQEQFILDGLHPLGKVETRKGRLIVFPNSHVHRVRAMENVAEEGIAKRRIVVFFIVNPLKRIVSTREVAPQQEYAGGTMSFDKAKSHRLKLMRERKYTKQDWNVREIELCEH